MEHNDVITSTINVEKFNALCDYLEDQYTIEDEQHLYNVVAACDFAHYRQFGESITGTTWIKAPDGFWPSHLGIDSSS